MIWWKYHSESNSITRHCIASNKTCTSCFYFGLFTIKNYMSEFSACLLDAFWLKLTIRNISITLRSHLFFQLCDHVFRISRCDNISFPTYSRCWLCMITENSNILHEFKKVRFLPNTAFWTLLNLFVIIYYVKFSRY